MENELTIRQFKEQTTVQKIVNEVILGFLIQESALNEYQNVSTEILSRLILNSIIFQVFKYKNYAEEGKYEVSFPNTDSRDVELNKLIMKIKVKKYE